MLTLTAGVLLGYLVLPLVVLQVEMEDYLKKLPVQPHYHSSPKPFLKDEDDEENSVPNLRPVQPVESRTLDTASSVQERLMQDHSLLSRQSLPTPTTPYVMKTKMLPDHQRKKILVTGGAGFVGSHLVDKLMQGGMEVVVVDNFFTGQKKNIAHWLHHPNFR